MTMLRNIVLILLLALAGISHALATPPNPLLWQVSNGDNRVYLLGSFHFLKADDYPLALSVNQAFADAEKVYFEIAPDEMHDPAQIQKMMRLGVLSGEQNLQNILRPEVRRKLEKYCAMQKISCTQFQKLKPWMAAQIISVAELQQAGMQPELGLDMHFAKLAAQTGKKTGALETLGEQFVLFDGMDIDEQGQFLEQTLDESAHAQLNIAELHRLWRNGDANGLWRMTGEEMRAKMPKLYQRLLLARNKAWLPQITALLRDNSQDDALVVVGSMHLLGDGGLIDLLRRQGYRIKRVR
jgi:uncharacterized protein YbaP (TraB family)